MVCNKYRESYSIIIKAEANTASNGVCITDAYPAVLFRRPWRVDGLSADCSIYYSVLPTSAKCHTELSYRLTRIQTLHYTEPLIHYLSR